MPQVDPHIEVIPEWIRAGIRLQVPLAQLHAVFGPTFERVATAITSAGTDIIGPAYACYFGQPSEVVDVEIGFGISSSIDSAELVVTEVPATDAVVGTHLGAYDQLEDSYNRLVPWMVDQGVSLADHMYEFYDTMPSEDGTQAITRLVFPLL
jgi:effector-binding domain-containing protein